MKRFCKFFLGFILFLAVDSGSVPVLAGATSAFEPINTETAISIIKILFYWKTFVAVVSTVLMTYSLFYLARIALGFAELLLMHDSHWGMNKLPRVRYLIFAFVSYLAAVMMPESIIKAFFYGWMAQDQ